MNTPYLLLPVGILSIFFYLLSYLLVKLGISTEPLHRRIWNIILLAIFLTTAIIGLLLAIQINYKLDWTFIKTALKWHVDFGIGMSFVGLFHLLHNWNYYLNLIKPIIKVGISKEKPKQKTSSLDFRTLKYLILLTGFISTVIQVLLIRQISTVFEGNEFMMAWTLGLWMLLTGIGAFLGNISKKNLNQEGLLAFILFITGILPIVAILIMTLVKNQIFPVGVMLSPANFLVIQLIVLTPICLVFGFTFSLLVRLFNHKESDFIKVYAFESIGSLIGGLFVTFLFIQWLTILQSLFIILLLITISLFVTFRSRVFIFSSVVVLIFAALTFILPVENTIKSFLFTNQKVLKSRETHNGNITITENSGQLNYYSNGSLLFSTDNTILNEENVHYAMLQRKKPENIMLFSGGVSGLIEEILKYPSVKSIDYVELNPSLVDLAIKYKPLPIDKRLHYLPIDGRGYIQKVEKKFDVVIFAIPGPTSIQINRFYTDEFLCSLKDKLTRNAIVVYGLPPAGNYISPVKEKIESSVFQTLKKNFANVEVIPGEKDYLLASDSSINIKITELYAINHVINRYVNPYYIDDYSIRLRGSLILKGVEGKNMINTDNKPLPVFYETLQFLSQFKSNNWLLFIIPIILLIIPLFFMGVIPKSLFITGFSASSIEILIIFSFQIVYGYVYSAIGLIIAVFMGGLALGSLLGYKFKITKKHFLACQSALVIYALIFQLLWYFHSGISNSISVLFLFFIMTLIPSTLVGFQFVAGTMLHKEESIKAATALYSADLVGSAFGVFVTTLLLLPLIGLSNCCLIIALLNFISILLTFISYKGIFRD